MKNNFIYSSHADAWNKVDSLEQQGLVKSALEIVNTIFEKAQTENNQPEQIKALFYQLKYNQDLEENEFVLALKRVDALREKKSEPLYHILTSIKAEMIWSYYSNNRYKFYNRSATAQFELGDITTWDLKTLLDTANKLYLASIEKGEALQKIKTEDYKYVLSYNDNTDFESVPTLYDFLAHRALNFFKNDEAAVTRPAAKFAINQPEFWGSDDQFLSISTQSEDSLSNLLNWTKTMQQLVRFQQNNLFPSARLYTTLERINFATEKSVLAQKNEWKEKALLQLQREHANTSLEASVNTALAQHWFNLPEEQRTAKQSLVEVRQLCIATIQKYPKSLGANQCEVIKNLIEKKSLSGKIEQYQPSNQPILTRVEFQNIDSVYAFIYETKTDNDYYYNIYQEVKKLKLLAKQQVKLPVANDFLNHSTEIALPALKLGNYLVVLGTSSEIKKDNINHFWSARITVTNLAYSISKQGDNRSLVQVVNRESGQPIHQATVSIYENEYNYAQRKDVKKLIGTYKTDEKGTASIPHVSTRYGQEVVIRYKNDELSSGGNLYKSTPTKTITTSDHLFTDRAIYRPGQTVYFKGIRLEESNKKSKIAVDQSITAQLLDVNHQKVSELKLTSNEYGSFSGSFKIPSSGLTGMMRISTVQGVVTFNVEEYKRPTFAVSFKKSKEEIQLGKKVKIEGSASAYSGSVVDNASVSYVVKRQFHIPYWYYRYRPISLEQVIVAQGNAQTNEKGEFNFDFLAEKDPTKDGLIYYNYTIEVDVTDANGETRSASKQLSLSEVALQLNVDASNLERSKNNTITVNAMNAEGESLPIKGSIRLIFLKNSNSRTKCERSWEDPDMPLLSAAEFDRLFPTIRYKKQVREESVTVKYYNFSTEKSSEVSIDASTLPAGDYVLEVKTTDKNGKEISTKQEVKIIDSKSTVANFDDFLFVQTKKSSYEPGETVDFILSSCLSNQPVTMEVILDGNIIERRNLVFNNDQKNISFKIEEHHRGGISFRFLTFKHGRYYQEETNIQVPYSNKELTVSFETFRDKLSPGQEEEWKLRISGPKKEKVAAELLITMYDASLDAFKKHSWNFQPHRMNYNYSPTQLVGFGESYGRTYGPYYYYYEVETQLPSLNWFGYYPNSKGYYLDGIQLRGARSGETTVTREDIKRMPTRSPKSMVSSKNSLVLEERVGDSAETEADGESKNLESGGGEIATKTEETTVPLRSNFNETAFFFPQLETDANGDIILKFKSPESLTKWKLLGIAHTKDLKTSVFNKEVVTQKEIMVQTNLPRFVRTGDAIVLTSKISNLTETVLNGKAAIQVLNAATLEDVSNLFKLETIQDAFEMNAKQSNVVSWKITVPEYLGALTIRVMAKAQNHTDGEELTVPVVTDKVLVTESMPLTNNGIGSKEYTFNKLVNNTSSTLQHHAVTLEYSSNPAWYVIQALPYLMEYPYDCSEQIFSRFYANSIASNIVRSSPKIKEVFNAWSKHSPEAFLSNLEKNQQLKSVLLEETPWVMQAQNETERKKRIALLFDFNKMDEGLENNLQQLLKAQVSNGGFPWFPGMRENRYITQHIVSGMGHLNQLNIVAVKENKKVQQMIKSAVKYLDARLLEDYNEWKKWQEKNKGYSYNPTNIQYLYARSFFTEIPFSKNEEEAFNFYKVNTEKEWLKFNLNNQAMLALASHRFGNHELATKIMNSISERSITTEEMGMYWKENERGYYWYQAPIETQALIIEALHFIKKDQQAINQAKVWLLRNKQTSDWKTTTATADASYALLLGGNSFTQQNDQVMIEVNGREIKPEDFGSQIEAGTGYFQTTWTGKEVQANMGKVKITRKTDGFSYGAMYWQYFEAMEKVTSAETSLKLKKQLFVVRQTSSGEVIEPIKDGATLKRGEKVRVRIELATDRNLEFVHLKDYRSAGFEPINVLSSFKYQGGLGYYESTKDLATHFFFDYLQKGNYVFEYDLRVFHSGDFSNGFAQIECMYAPEFKSHSNGVRVKVTE